MGCLPGPHVSAADATHMRTQATGLSRNSGLLLRRKEHTQLVPFQIKACCYHCLCQYGQKQ